MAKHLTPEERAAIVARYVETLTRMLDHSERKVAHWKHQAGKLGADVEGLVH